MTGAAARAVEGASTDPSDTMLSSPAPIFEDEPVRRSLSLVKNDMRGSLRPVRPGGRTLARGCDEGNPTAAAAAIL